MFLFRLALALGFPHPDYLTQQLTCSQLMDWMAFSSIEPIGEYRNELRHGQMMALHCNINRDSKSKPEPYRAIDFMNFIEKPEEKELTPAEIEAELTRLYGV